jgi:hypothetical protein
LLVSPPRERPSASRLGFAADFLSFDQAPCVHHGRRDNLRVNINWWRMPGTGGVLMRPHDPGIDPNRPPRALAQIGVTAQLMQNPGPGPIT